jgi:hypothetical protein
MDFHRPWVIAAVNKENSRSASSTATFVTINMWSGSKRVTAGGARCGKDTRLILDESVAQSFRIPLPWTPDGEKRKYGALLWRDYVGCGERRDGRWNVIVIPPVGEREDIRIVHADLEFLEAIENAGKLRKRGAIP